MEKPLVGRAPPVRVAFSHNYSIIEVRRQCDKGVYPAQHLYGAGALADAGMDVELIDMPAESLVTRMSGRLGWRFGHLGHLPRAVRRGSPSRVDVAGEPYHVALLARLRARGWRRQPLVAVMHHTLPPARLSAELSRGIDYAVCLSRSVQRQLVDDHGRSPEHTPWLPWGPDLAFPGYVSSGDDFVLSCGKTARDTAVLVDALGGTEIPARIYGAESEARNITAVGAPGQLGFEYGRLLPDLQRAAIFAIPLRDTGRLLGLTEVADALALGKPIVMTRTPFVDIDLEAVGCGIWVEPGDVAGWRSALMALWEDPARRAEMGTAGRRYAESEWNAAAFGAGMVDTVRLAAEGA